MSNQSRSVLTAITLLAFSISASTVGQQSNSTQQQPIPSHASPDSQSGTYRIQVNSKMVVLDVVVTDKQGEIANNLTKDDFQVYEDKVPQTIRSMDRSQSYLSPANISVNSTSEVDSLEPNAPVSIIVLDEINTRFEDEAFARYSLKKYLNAEGNTLLQPTMLVAVSLRHFMVLRDYTTSKKEILSALDHHFATYPWEAQSGSWVAEQFNAAFDSLMEVAEATSGHPGHKNMIWVGRGFPSIDMISLPPVEADMLKSAIETCTNMLRDARVTLYTVDPAGIASSPPPQDMDGFDEEDPFGGQVDFNAMAKATGGTSFYGRNDVDHLIGASVRDGANFYTVSYIPSNSSESSKEFRNIRVIMKDPKLRATTREGYYTQTPALSSVKNPDGKLPNRLMFDLILAGKSMMVYDSVPISVIRDPSVPDNFRINVNAPDIDLQNDGLQNGPTDIAVLVESFDRKGKMLKHTAKIFTVQLPPNSTETVLKARLLTVMLSISTEPPAARIRFVVRINRTGKLGADNFFLVDKKTLSDPTTGLTPGHVNN